jgi:hypothetical protein
MRRIGFFDSNCLLGRVSVSKSGFVHRSDQLLDVIDYFGIDDALVYHARSKESHPADGNKSLLDEIKGSKRLHPQWVLLPSHTGEFPTENEVVKKMVSLGVRAARIFPHQERSNFSISDWCAGALFAALSRRRIPLFIDSDEINWESVHNICERYPNLPLVLTNVGYRIDRYLYPLFERFKNLYVEISGYCAAGGIEEAVRRFGAERFLFGTRLPFFTPAVAVSMVLYSKISDSEKQLIAGENLRRLLEQVRK